MSNRHNSPANTGNLLALKKVIRFLRSNCEELITSGRHPGPSEFNKNWLNNGGRAPKDDPIQVEHYAVLQSPLKPRGDIGLDCLKVASKFHLRLKSDQKS